MSHFAVLVTGDNLESALAPFDENLEVDPTWVVEVDDITTSPEVARLLDRGAIPSPDHVEEWYSSNYGNKNIRRVGNSIERLSTYNQNAQWDWWTIGGRYDNMILLKDGTRVDSAVIRDIDFLGMKAKALIKATDAWVKYREATEDLTPPLPWDEFRAGYPSIEDAREAWAQDPWRIAANQSQGGMFWTDLHEHFCVGSEEPFGQFLVNAERSAFLTYAFLHNGKWYQQGRMGWFGMADNEMKKEDWAHQFEDFIASLDINTQITVVDCHI